MIQLLLKLLQDSTKREVFNIRKQPGVSSDHSFEDIPELNTYLAFLSQQSTEILDSDGEEERLSHRLKLQYTALQNASKKSRHTIIDSAQRHASLSDVIPILLASITDLHSIVLQTGAESEYVSSSFNNSLESELLVRRKEALFLYRNVDRVVNLLEVPTLVRSAVESTPGQHHIALELYDRSNRLFKTYPESNLVTEIHSDIEQSVQVIVDDLLQSLLSPSLRFSGASKTSALLLRLLPTIDTLTYMESISQSSSSHRHNRRNFPIIYPESTQVDRLFGIVYLLSRIETLAKMLEALAPLRKLADDEKAVMGTNHGTGLPSGSTDRHTERYLKRYIELFREHGFLIISTFKNLFPSSISPGLAEGSALDGTTQQARDSEFSLYAPISTFTMTMIDDFFRTLGLYLPCIRNRTIRDSVLTQVMYCATSFGKLGLDFSIFLWHILGSEWLEVIKYHRELAYRLESVLDDTNGIPRRVV